MSGSEQMDWKITFRYGLAHTADDTPERRPVTVPTKLARRAMGLAENVMGQKSAGAADIE